MQEFAYEDKSGNIIPCTSRKSAENICKAAGYTLRVRDVSDWRVESIRG